MHIETKVFLTKTKSEYEPDLKGCFAYNRTRSYYLEKKHPIKSNWLQGTKSHVKSTVKQTARFQYHHLGT